MSSSRDTDEAKPALPLWARIGLFLLLYVVLSVVGQVVLGQATLEMTTPGLILGWSSAMALAVMGLTAWFWTGVDRRPWSEIRLRLMDGASWRLGAVLWLALAVPSYALEAAFGHLRLLGWAVDDPGQIMTRAVLHMGTAIASAVMIELPFWGYLFGTLEGRAGDGRVVLSMAVLYTVGHLWLDHQRSLLNVIDTLLMGAAIAYLRLASGSVALPVAVASCAYLAALLVSSDTWLEPVVLLAPRPAGLWFGDDWYAGLADVWLSLLWLTGIYAWVYRRMKDEG